MDCKLFLFNLSASSVRVQFNTTIYKMLRVLVFTKSTTQKFDFFVKLPPVNRPKNSQSPPQERERIFEHSVQV